MAESSTHSFFLPTPIAQSIPAALFSTLESPLGEALAIDDDMARRIAVMQALLDSTTIKNFIEYYFNNLDTKRFQIYAWSTTQAPDTPENPNKANAFKAIFGTTSSFRKPEHNGQKIREVHPLTEREYRRAKEFLSKNGAYECGAFLIQDAMLAYTQGLKDRFLPRYTGKPEHKEISESIESLKNGIEFNPFINEFIPVLAYELDKQHEQNPSQIDRATDKALTIAVFTHASKAGIMISEDFEGDENGNIDEQRAIECPFRQAIGPVMNACYAQENSVIKLQKRIEPAGLLKFTIIFLRQHGAISQAPSPALRP